MATNQVQFEGHAIERIYGRYKQITNYAIVQSTLQNKPLRSGKNQRITIATFPRRIRVYDNTTRNGQYIEGNKLVAKVHVTNDNEVEVITLELV